VYRAEIGHIDPPACKEGNLEWIRFSQLLEIPTPRTDWYIYKYIVENKNFMFDVAYDHRLKIISMREEIENRVLTI
jgi:8-oxo-dGTP diphosphatase